MRRSSLLVAALALVSVVGIASCQSYNVDPVKPSAAKVATKITKIAQRKAPNVVLVVDRSGSMSDSPDNSASNVCPSAGQAGKPCKWDELLAAMEGSGSTPGFMQQLADRGSTSDPVRLGMVTFSGANDDGSGNSCAAGTIRVAPAGSTVSAMTTVLNGITPSGGTPTTLTMQVASGAFEGVTEDGRSNYIVLLTDGAPNCNPNFQADANNCNSNDPQRCVSPGGCFGQSQSPIGCLDEDNLVTTIGTLQKQAIGTFVIGFGAGFGPNDLAYDTLNKSAIAGGFPIKDQNGQVQTPAFYLATDANALKAALDAIVAQIGNVCDYPLDAPPASKSSIEVIVTPDGATQGTVLTQDQWDLQQGNHVVITDAQTCSSITSAPADHPTTVSINYLGQ